MRKMKTAFIITVLLAICLAGEPQQRHLSKGLKAFTDLIANDPEEGDLLEIMNYISSRFHYECYKLDGFKNSDGETIGDIIHKVNRYDETLMKMRAEMVEDAEQLRRDVFAECSKIENDSKTRDNEMHKAMTNRYNELKQSFCDVEAFESCLSSECCIKQTYSFPNLALGKPAWQSSYNYWDKGEPSKAVDGNRNSAWTGNSCFHTKSENHPWWMVDLGSEKHVGRVVLVNIGEAGSRLQNLVVTVSLDKDEEGIECGRFGGPGHNGQVIEIKCANRILGRFVKLTMYAYSYFHLCEVEIYDH